MPGTLLASDWQSSVEDELHRHVQDTMAAATQAAAAIPTLSVPQISAPSVDPQAVLNELNQHVQGIVANATQAVQPAVQQVQQLGSVGDQLQAHVQTVLGANNGGPFTPLSPPRQQQDQTTLGGGQPTITTLGGGSNAPVAPLGAPPAAAGGDVLGGAPSADTTTAGTADRSMSYQDYAKAAAKRAGIDPNVFTAQIQQESGFNPTARSPAGAIGIAQFMPETAKSAGIDPTDAYASLDAAAAEDAKRLKQYEGDWGKTLASYNAGAGAVAQYNGIPPYAETQTYVKTIMGNAQKAADAAGTTISNTVAPGPSVPTTAPVTTAQARAADLGYKDISQFGDQQLTPAEAYAACGPAAAVRFAERMGRQPTLREATDLAASVGWTAQSGMAGISSEQSLMTKLGVPTKLVQGDQWDVFAKEAQTGNPVTISTPGHYFFADAYNPDTGAFHVGQSGKDLRQGSEWMTPAQMESLMGKAQGALFADSPVTPVQSSAAGTTSTAPTALGGTTGTAPAPINVPGQEAKPPLVMGQNQPVTPLESGSKGLTPIQTAEDSVAGVIGDIKRAGQQAVATLGGAADQAGQAVQQHVIQPLQATAAAVGGAADQLGSSVQQNVVQPVQSGAASTATTVPPVLGGAASDLGTAARGTADTTGQTLGGAATTVDGARRQVQDAIDNLPAKATIAQTRQVLGETLADLGPRALEIAGDLPLPMGGTVSDLQAPLRGVQAGVQTIEDQRQQQIAEPADMATQFQQNVNAARQGDWGAFARGTLDLAQASVGQTALGGAQGDLSQSVSAALTAAGIDPNAARVVGQIANIIGPMALERAIPGVVSAAERGSGAAVNAGLEAIDRLAPPEVALATTRRAGESADDYLARLANEARAQSNPYDLQRSPPQPAAVPLSADEVLTHLDYLDQLHTQNDARIAELQNRLSSGARPSGDFSGTVVRPPWAAGWTNQGLDELARRNGLNPYEANWWERGNFVQGTGEMREDVGQSGIAGSPQYRGTRVTQQSPTEMRAELARLEAQQTQIDTAHESIWEHAGQGGDVYAQSAAEALPFEGGRPDTGPAQARPGSPGETAPSPATSREAPAGVPGPPAAPEPTARAEPAPAELGATADLLGARGVTAAPERSRLAPGVARVATEGFRAPEPTEPPLPPVDGPPAPSATPPPPPPGGTSPELDKLNAMYDGKKPAPPSSIADRLQNVSDSLTRAFTDRQVDINRAQERYAANLGRPLRGDEMAAELQRLASDPAAQVKVDQGLKPAIQSVGADYPALRNYVTLRSNIEVADNLAARTGKAEVGSDRLFSGGLNREQSAKALQDLETQLGPERFARVQAAADQVTTFNQSLRQRLVEAGVLDGATAAQLDAQYPNWAKTRILDYMADPAGGQGAGTKLGLSDRGLREYTLKGTERAREDPVASTVAYAHQVERMAMKNEAFNAFLNIDQAGATRMLREVPQSYTPKSNEVTMIGFVDGQKQKYVTDNKALGAAINGAGVLATPEWTSAWQKVFRSLATSRNPVFLAGNAALDIPTYLLRQSVREGGPQALPRILGELARGYGDAFQGLLQGEFRGPATSEFLKRGGGQSGYFTGGEGQTQRAVAEMQRKNVFQINSPSDLGRLTKDLLTLHPVEALGERIELGPRVAAMRLAERRGANPTQAVIDGRTVTVDFSQGGTVTKYLNNFIPFFNVGFQGPAQVARAFRENPRAFVATVGSLIGIPSSAAEVWNRSDPQRAKDYADVPQYVKDQGVVVMLPGEAPVDAQGNRKPLYAVVKLREWAPFAAAAREATARVLGDDTRSWQDVASSIGAGLSPTQATSAAQAGTEPLAGIPILPAAAQLEFNKDFFRNRTIVTQRADQNASALSRALAPALQQVMDRAGANVEIRPSAIDFLIRNQGAGVGGAILGASDLAAGNASDVVGPTGLPVVGGLAGRFVGSQTGDALQQARDQTLTTAGRQILRNNGITLTPGAVSSSVNQIPLKIEEETRYQQLANRYIDEAIARTAASPDFATKTQVGKQSMIDQAMQGARARAGNEVLNTVPAAEKQRRLRTKSTAA